MIEYRIKALTVFKFDAPDSYHFVGRPWRKMPSDHPLMHCPLSELADSITSGCIEFRITHDKERN